MRQVLRPMSKLSLLSILPPTSKPRFYTMKWTTVKTTGAKDAWASQAQRVRKTLRLGVGYPAGDA